MDDASDDRLRALTRAYLTSFERCDPDVIAACVHPAFVNEHASALGRGCVGRDEYRRRLPEFLASLPGLRYDAGDPIVEGDRVAAPYRLHARGRTPAGEDVPVTVDGVMLLRFDGDLIAERLDVWDALTYLRQTGQA